MSCYHKTVKQQKQWPFEKNFKFLWKNVVFEINYSNQSVAGPIQYIRKNHSKKALRVIS